MEAATVLGEPATADELRTAAGLTLFAAVLAGAGPFGVGVVRRTRVPKVVGILVFVPIALAAGYYLVTSGT